MELTIVAAFELEFYLIDQENVNGRPQPPRSPISGKRPQSVQVLLHRRPRRIRRVPPGHHRRRPRPASGRRHRRQIRTGSSRSTSTTSTTRPQGLRPRGAAQAPGQEHRLPTRWTPPSWPKPYPGQAGERTARAYLAARQARQQHLHQRGSRAERHIAPCDRGACSMAFLLNVPTPTAASVREFYVPNAPSWGLDNRGPARAWQPGRGTPGTPRGRRRRQPLPATGGERCWQRVHHG